MTLARSICEAPLQADEKQTFVTEIATQHGRKLRRYLAARLRNTADVSDLVQEVFLRLLRVERHESIRNPEAYVMTVAAHVLHQHTLRLATAPQAVAGRRLEQLDYALSQMKPNVHATFVLHRRDGLTLEEIGKQLGVSRPMVKKYLAKALIQCRAQLGEDAPL